MLNGEAAFRPGMAQKTEGVMKPTGERQLFAKPVIQVTDLIHNSGRDANTVSKADIIRAAMEVFHIGAPTSENRKPAPRSKSKPVVRRRSKPGSEIPSRKAVPRKAPAVEPEVPQPEASEPPKTVAESPSEVPGDGAEMDTIVRGEAPLQALPVVVGQENTELRSANKGLSGLKNIPVPVPDEDGSHLRPDMPPHLLYSPMFSLSAALEQFVENLDRQPGHEKRLDYVRKLTSEFSNLARIPKQIAAFAKTS